MPDQQSDDSENSSNGRRRIFQGLGGISAAVGLAGCSGLSNSDGDDGSDSDGSDGSDGSGSSDGSDGSDGSGSSDGSDGSDSSDGNEVPEIDADAATNWDNYSVTELAVDETMMSLDVAPDGRVFYITRGALFGADTTTGTANIGYIYPDSGETGSALELPVGTVEEDGGQGITFDPNFEENGWVYIFYVPPEGELEDPDNPYMLVSRFTMAEDSIDPESETEILRIPHQRETCCHVGGYLEFDPDGNLFITTGDDTNPFESSGYAPIDGRDGRKNFDSRRTAGNTADLRGSILRITPEDDGSYSIPDDNLFTEANGYADELEQDLVKPEIYVMGCRNPYTISVDEESGNLFLADYGPDASGWDASRGPVGIVEYREICEAHNAGWPFARGYNYPYRRYDFENEESGQPYWPRNITNDSPNNDGLTDLPPVKPADIWYPRSWEGYLDAPDWVDMPVRGERSFPELPAGGAPMAGPRYRYNEEFGEGALNSYFDGKQFIMEWGVNYIKYITYNDDGSVEFDDFLPDEEFQSPNDMAVGPNGRLFLQTYGPPWAGEEGKVYMIEYEA